MSLTALLALSVAMAGVIAEPVADVAPAPAPTITAAPAREARMLVDRQGANTYETTSPLPLTQYNYPFSQIPYQVNPYAIGRGPQTGYNICNSTTENANSQCQTAVLNSISDFCFWGSPIANETIGDVEAEVVAYCSKSGHGTRIFPPYTFQSVQFMKTPAYIQIVGFFNQTTVGLQANDYGGELDPHGADLLGNPLGGLFYSTGFESGNNSTYVQTQSWNNFVGSGQFCLKLCDPSYSTNMNYCQNIYDLIGCDYNMPADYTTLQNDGLFIACEGGIQSEVGTYTSGAQTLTWSQPATLDPNTVLPWTPVVPPSSNCVTYHSTDLFPSSNLGYAAGITGSSTSGSASASSTSGASSRSGSSSMSGSASSTSASSSAAATSSKSAAINTQASMGVIGLVLAAVLKAIL